MNITNRRARKFLAKFVGTAGLGRGRGRAKAAILCAIAPIAGVIMPAEAGVQFTGVSSGAAAVSQNGSVTNIRTTNNAILNFSQFNVAAGSTVDFIQASAASRELNRINSAAPSLINGSIVSNGAVYFVNPAGVIFGNGATIDVNRIVVAGSHMSNSDFLSGVDHFTDVSGIVSNAGTIHANQALLVGSQVINTGSIVAPSGMVAMLAGSDVLVSEQGSHVAATVVPAVVPASGNSASSTKDIRTSALAAGDPYSLAIRHTGTIQAGNVLINGGGGQVQVSGTINASSTTAGTTGGNVAITGGEVDLASAYITVAGPAGGGVVQIGGGPHESSDLSQTQDLSLDSASVIDADATEIGNGGSIVLWSASTTTSAATLTARGGLFGGNGGTVETSGDIVNISVAPNELAPRGNVGTWLLDPLDITIVNSTATTGLTGTSTISNSTIDAGLQSGNVTITTNQTGGNTGIITQNPDATISGSLASPRTLTLQANNTVDLEGTITASGGGGLSLVISATNGITISGSVNTDGGGFTATGTSFDLTGTLTDGGVATASNAFSVNTTGSTSTIAINGPIIWTGATGRSLTLESGGTVIITDTGSVTSTAGALPVAFYSTGSAGSGLVELQGTVSITGAFVSAGGQFEIGVPVNSGTSPTLTAASANLNIQTTAQQGDSTAVNNGAVTIEGAVQITGSGGFSAGGTTSFTTNSSGQITTTSGPVTITNTGLDSIGEPISSGAAVTVTLANQITVSTGASISSSNAGGVILSAGTTGAVNTSAPITTTGGPVIITGSSISDGGTMTTSGGNITFTSTGSVTQSTGADINTGGGSFLVTGTSFASSSPITDNGVTTNTHTLSINTKSGSGSITIGGNITWAGPTSTVQSDPILMESNGGVTINTGVTITDSNSGNVPISLYAIGSATGVTINGTIDTTGAFNGDGGTFTLATQTGTNAGLTATSVDINDITVTPDGQPLNNGSVFISQGIVAFGNVTISGTTEMTDNQNGNITTNGGNVVINNTGDQIVGNPVNTGTSSGSGTGGNFTATGGDSFVSGADGTITTGGGDVTISTTGNEGIEITSEVNTQGGNITLTGQTFTDQGLLTDGGIVLTGKPVTNCTINMTGNKETGDITGVTVTWQGNTNSGQFNTVSVEGNGNVTIDTVSATGTVALPVMMFTTNGNDTCSISGVVNTTGDFTSAGGAFTVESIGSLSARSVSIGTVTETPDLKPVTPGATTISGPVTTVGNMTVDSTAFTSSGTGTIITSGGDLNIACSGTVSIGAQVQSIGGAINASTTGAFNTTGTSTVSSGGGNISFQGTTSVSIDAPVSTSGGNFTAAGGTFENSAEISDGGVNDTKPQGLAISTTTGDITIGGEISWAASLSPITLSVPGTASIDLGSTIVANTAQPINLGTASIALVGTSTITGGSITLGSITDGTQGSDPDLIIQSSGAVRLGAVVPHTSTVSGTTTTSFVGSISVLANGTSTPTTTLTGNITVDGNAVFAGTVNLPTNISITSNDFDQNAAGDVEFDGPIQGPGGLTLTTSLQLRLNGDIGTVTPLAFLNLSTGDQGIASFNAGPANNEFLFPITFDPKSAITVDIASGGSFKDNDISPNNRVTGIIASLSSYGPVTINIGNGSAANSANLYAVGENEKFSSIGAITINTNGGTIQTGDISSLGNMTLEASTIEFIGRAPTISEATGEELDTGMDLIAAGQMSLPSNATYLISKGSVGTGTLDTPVFVAQSYAFDVQAVSSLLKSSFSIVGGIDPAAMFSEFATSSTTTVTLLIDLTPATLAVTAPRFVPPIPFVFDYPIAGAFPREMTTAGQVPNDLKIAFEPPYPGPILDQDLKDNGLYTRDPSDEEIVAATGTMAVYNDIPENPRPKASDYRVVNTRLDPRRVEAYLDECRNVFGANAEERRAQMATDLQNAWDAYVSQNGNQPANGNGFARYCANTPAASAASADLQVLHSLRVKLGDLGLSYKEAQVAFQYNLLHGMSPNGMRQGDLAAAVASSGGAY